MHTLFLAQKTIAPTELPGLLATIEQRMRAAERIGNDAAEEHWQAFTMQMGEKFGIEKIGFDEPYLPLTLAASSLTFLRLLEKLMLTVQRGAEDEDFQTSILDFDEPLLPQLENRLALETQRYKLAAKQELDKTRQQQFGIRSYVWRTGGDGCSICAPMEGKICRWDEGVSPGGMHPNCQCSAEPLLDGSDIDDPPIEPVYPLEALLAGLTTGVARAIAREIMRRIGRRFGENAENAQTAEKISKGHAYEKHKKEFPEIKNQEDFKRHIEDIMNNPDDIRQLERGRTGYWDDETGTVVIENPNDPDGGTVFRPDFGKDYFDNVLE